MNDQRQSSRIASLDIIRGAVMVLMAIDHVRVYSGVPAGGRTAGVFFTRWVTHFCAPAFVFFAGTAAYLHGRRIGPPALARYLVSRGVLLVLLEFTVIRASWTFNVDYSQFILAGVIWMLGVCMVLMAGLVWLPTRAIGAFGLAVIFAQQLVGLLGSAMPKSTEWFWTFLYFGGEVKLGENGPTVAVLYSIVPWIGVMAAGYAFGAVMTREPAERRRFCLRTGLSATALFLLLGSVAVMMTPPGDNAPPALFRLLGQQKYPASQLFLMMTLGPTIALIPLVESKRAWFWDVLVTFGRVPLFYYLLHIPTIHIAALIVNLMRTGSVHNEWYAFAPYASVPPDHRWGLPLLYLVFVIVVAVLYVPCRWYADAKVRQPRGWHRYI
jgi:uncharacterized membrane protein